MGVPETVTELLEPVVSTLDVALLDVEWNGNTLRLVIDGPDGQPVTTDQLASVNRLASPILDQHDPVPGRYTLEVSSPGVERPLVRAAHFERAVGEEVIIKFSPGLEPRRIKGELLTFDAESETATVEVTERDGNDLAESEQQQVALADIAKARTHFDWGPSPKPGGKSNQKNANQNKKKQNHSGTNHSGKKSAGSKNATKNNK